MSTSLAATTPWALGDFHVIGASIATVGDTLCEDCNVTAGARVLDLACGSGNTALGAARRGAAVTGLDLVESLIDRARARASTEGLEIDFESGNMQELPYADEQFDFVLSTFGVMFASDHDRAAREVLRVCKRGGTIGLSNWTVESFPGAMFAIAAKYAPPPAGARPATDWGGVSGLRRLFDGRIAGMRLLDHFVRAHFNSADEMLSTFRQYFGPMRSLFQRVPAEQHADLEKELLHLIARYNRAADGTQATAMSYVNVIMTKR
jgi:ubiquinone/menaquinone biosynthesis C-methylase UbiE